MNYEPDERIEVISRAYTGLYKHTPPALFEKYLHFIDVYSEIKEKERNILYDTIIQKKETVMLAQYIMDKGAIRAKREALIDVLEVRFGDIQKSLRHEYRLKTNIEEFKCDLCDLKLINRTIRAPNLEFVHF